VWLLISVFFDVVLHRRGPEALPASQAWLRGALVAYGLVLLATLSVVPTTQARLIAIVVHPIVDIAALYLLLELVNQREKFLQVATAAFGTAVILNVLALPILYWREALAASPEQTAGPNLLLLVLFFWSLDVLGFIVSRAIARPYIVGLAIVVVYELTSIAVVEAISPAAG